MEILFVLAIFAIGYWGGVFFSPFRFTRRGPEQFISEEDALNKINRYQKNSNNNSTPVMSIPMDLTNLEQTIQQFKNLSYQSGIEMSGIEFFIAQNSEDETNPDITLVLLPTILKGGKNIPVLIKKAGYVEVYKNDIVHPEANFIGQVISTKPSKNLIKSIFISPLKALFSGQKVLTSLGATNGLSAAESRCCHKRPPYPPDYQ